MAAIHAALGDRGVALDWLDRAIDERSYWLIYLNVDPALDSLRDEPRFAELRTRACLPE
ncbi:MAG: TPR end-of-group domain-containing protein [Acidimicrobiia bacterium]